MYASPSFTLVLANKSLDTSTAPCKLIVPGSMPPILVPASKLMFTPSDLMVTPANVIVLPEAEISTTYIVLNHLSSLPKLIPTPPLIMLPAAS